MNKFRSLSVLAAILAVLSAAAAALVCGSATERPVAVTFINVGQGDAAIIVAGRVEALIDGGPGRQVLAGIGRAMPLTDRTIEYVILTHPHADHVSGLPAVFEHYRVGRLILGGPGADTPEFAALRAAAVAHGVPVSVVRAGDAISLGERASLAVLHASNASINDKGRDLNEESVVVRLDVNCAETGGAAAPCGRALFMGDAGARTESALLAAGADIAADVLKVGHHGSRQATTAVFVDAVRPRAAVISVGKNTYGHPAPATMQRLEAAGVEVRRTDRDGDVLVRFDRAGPILSGPGRIRP